MPVSCHFGRYVNRPFVSVQAHDSNDSAFGVIGEGKIMVPAIPVSHNI
jgi:hypothetical protein